MPLFTLPPLPFSEDALEPIMSAETLRYHYEKHHNGYVTALNKLTEGTPWAEKSLEEIILESDGPLFNNAAQAWNHTFFWNGLSPDHGTKIPPSLERACTTSFGSVDQFKKAFSQQANQLFGSGWIWLAKNESGLLQILPMSNAGNPLCKSLQPILVLDVWEHAYYIDYRNEKAKYIEGFWSLVDWESVSQRLSIGHLEGEALKYANAR
jgi:superoxide dismutase, Fe-Mn family